ncbi:MAG: hypothetical protein ACRC6E_09200, partial [Fusobacteriaceae bacterium]
MINSEVTLIEILESLPHKFRNGKNVKIIFEAYVKQYNSLWKSYIDLMQKNSIHVATGNHLDIIGRNFKVFRGKMDDKQYRQEILFMWGVLKSSGNVHQLNRLFTDFLSFDDANSELVEFSNANIVLRVNRSSSEGYLLNKLTDVLKTAKPVGVGYKIEQYTDMVLLDRYFGVADSDSDVLIDRYETALLVEGISEGGELQLSKKGMFHKSLLIENTGFFRNDLFMYSEYKYNLSVDSYVLDFIIKESTAVISKVVKLIASETSNPIMKLEQKIELE